MIFSDSILLLYCSIQKNVNLTMYKQFVHTAGVKS